MFGCWKTTMDNIEFEKKTYYIFPVNPQRASDFNHSGYIFELECLANNKLKAGNHQWKRQHHPIDNEQTTGAAAAYFEGYWTPQEHLRRPSA